MARVAGRYWRDLLGDGAFDAALREMWRQVPVVEVYAAVGAVTGEQRDAVRDRAARLGLPSYSPSERPTLGRRDWSTVTTVGDLWHRGDKGYIRYPSGTYRVEAVETLRALLVHESGARYWATLPELTRSSRHGWHRETQETTP